MADRKTEFWWVSVHGADPEPAEKTEHKGRACIYTLGCADPFYLDGDDPAVVFVPHGGSIEAHEIVRPLHPNKAAAKRLADFEWRRRENARLAKLGLPLHGWRGPR